GNAELPTWRVAGAVGAPAGGLIPSLIAQDRMAPGNRSSARGRLHPAMAHPTARLLVLSLALLTPLVGRASAREPDPFEARLRGFLDAYCVTCHGPEVQRRRLRLDRLPAAFDDQAR